MNKHRLRERIILAPGIKKGELLKNLALHGVSTFNLRIMNAGELAQYALTRSGVLVSQNYIDTNEEAVLISQAVTGEVYFSNIKYTDIVEIAAAVRRMRSLVVEDNEEECLEMNLSKGIFQEKNQALLHVYRKYMKILQDRDLIDAVSLIRKAVSDCSDIAEGADFLMISEIPLTPLEERLINAVSGGSVHTVSRSDLYEAEASQVKIASYKNCYGVSNEVETVISDIYAGKKTDQCTVAVTDAGTYSQLFFDYAVMYDLPVTFGCGIPVINADPAKLLKLYYTWSTSGFFGTDAFQAMLLSPSFDRKRFFDELIEEDIGIRWDKFCETAGALRLTNDQVINAARMTAFEEVGRENASYLSPLKVLARELALPTEKFIRKYASVREGSYGNTGRLLAKLDRAALNVICDDLSVMKGMATNNSLGDIIEAVLKKSVLRESAEPGKIHITDIRGAFTSVRKNLYITGLSASKYPGSPKENHLLLDADLKDFGAAAEMYTSENRILMKREILRSLVHVTSGLNCEIHLSWSGMNVSELKKDNTSSMIFELYREEQGSRASTKDLENRIQKIGYFDPPISVSREIGKAYTEEKKIVSSGTKEDERRKEILSLESYLDREYSPSALGTFFNCRRQFYLKYILGLPEEEETDPFTVIPPTDLGTLAHKLMETLANQDMSYEDFIRLSEDTFDRYIATHPVLIREHIQSEKDEFLEIMAYAYQSDRKREVVLREEDVHTVHESGVKLHGYPDRVEKLPDGTFLVVDYKTGRTVAHKEDDIETCLQIVVYAYIMEKQGYPVSGGEFRYLRQETDIACKFDDDMKQVLNEKLTEFRKALETGLFPIPEKPDDKGGPCTYCKYAAVCGKNNGLSEKGEEE